MLECWLAWSSAGLVQATTGTHKFVNTTVLLGPESIVLLWLSLTSGFYNLSDLFSKMVSESWDRDVLFVVKYSKVTYSLCFSPVVGFYTNHYGLCKVTSLLSWRAALILVQDWFTTLSKGIVGAISSSVSVSLHSGQPSCLFQQVPYQDVMCLLSYQWPKAMGPTIN